MIFVNAASGLVYARRGYLGENRMHRISRNPARGTLPKNYTCSKHGHQVRGRFGVWKVPVALQWYSLPPKTRLILLRSALTRRATFLAFEYDRVVHRRGRLSGGRLGSLVALNCRDWIPHRSLDAISWLEWAESQPASWWDGLKSMRRLNRSPAWKVA